MERQPRQMESHTGSRFRVTMPQAAAHARSKAFVTSTLASAALYVLACVLVANRVLAAPRFDGPSARSIEGVDSTLSPRTPRPPIAERTIGGLPVAFEPAKKFSAQHLDPGFDPREWLAHHRWLLLFPRHEDGPTRTAESVATGVAELRALDARESRVPDPMRRGWPLPPREAPPHEADDVSPDAAAAVDGATEDERIARRIALDVKLALALAGLRSADLVDDDHDLATIEGAPLDVAAASLRIGLHAPTTSLSAALRNETLDGVAIGILALIASFDSMPVNDDKLDALAGIATSDAFAEDVRSCAILALGRLDRLDRIANEMRTDDLRLSPYLRAHLVTAMGLTRDSAHTAAILEHVLDLDMHIRWAALRALGGLLDATGRLTGDAPLEGADVNTARDDATRRLRTMLSRRLDPRTRAEVQFALARIAGVRAAEWIHAANLDAHGSPRTAAVLAIALSGARCAEPRALELMLDSSERDDVRAAGALALGIYGEASESTLRRLRGMLPDTVSTCLREAACEAIALLRDISANDDLVAIVTAPAEPPRLRSRAAVALARIGGTRATNALVSVVDDVDTEGLELRAEILRALALAPAPDAVPLLVRRARTSPDLAIRRAAVRALGYTVHPRHAPESLRLLADRNALLVGPVGIASPFDILRALH